MPTNEFLKFATTGTPNVESQASYAGDASTGAGFSAGVAASAKCNKVWRQGAFVAHCVSQFIVNVLSVSTPDDGDDTTWVANFIKAIKKTFNNVHTPVIVAFSATPTFDCSLGDTFEITLTGNVTSSTISNAVAGQRLLFCIIQDGTGGRTFAWSGSALGSGAIDPGINARSVQEFYVANDGSIRAITGISVT